MKKIMFTVLSVVMLAALSYAQNPTKTSTTTPHQTVSVNNGKDISELTNYYNDYQKNLSEVFDGTYQIIVTGNKKLVFTDEFFQTISDSRLEKKANFLKVSDDISIHILSASSVNSKRFVPYTQMFVVQ